MAERTVPYGDFNYLVKFDGNELFGGFSEVSGLGMEIGVAQYRTGNEAENHPRKIPGMTTVSDITLRRGIISSADLWTWLDDTRRTGPVAKKNISITLQDEAHNDVQTWSLTGVFPMRYNGPSLNARGGSEVAIEELVLACESFTIE
ncbi:phage tail protein [Candidatus Chloroploca sp. M-50]|uniref:Phage tail protein n=2 Tax=Candidatus Chloroploca TaxID=1579476 RepID=A0A2H3KVI8_9CHLR|nr:MULTISPECIES: phage tail protein [Candidatus Chloroploca]MBP1467347.1 phage tail protein [Candidatus Chloroploca mongolica]PDV97896.1 phage tail protein [Candidatus Chloroploca asiatica]